MRFLPFALLLVFSLPALSEEVNWYVYGGLSLHSEETETLVGDGIGLQLGLGAQLNQTFGLEFRIDTAPAIEPDSLIDEVEQEFNISVINYEIETTPNVYSSILGTLTFPMNDTTSIILRAGYTTYSVETEFLIDYAEDSRFYYQDLDFSITEEGWTCHMLVDTLGN